MSATTILLAEDEDDVRDLIATFLESRGYTVLAAGNGAAALACARSHAGPIHLLLTDVVMPIMTGVDLARQLLREWPGLDVIFMSGYVPPLAEIRGCGPVAFLAKPFSLSTLEAAVKTPALARA